MRKRSDEMNGWNAESTLGGNSFRLARVADNVHHPVVVVRSPVHLLLRSNSCPPPLPPPTALRKERLRRGLARQV